MKRAELEEIMREVKENQFRLEKCEGHSFKPVPHRPCRYKCIYCNGEADSTFVKGYNQGLKHKEGK